MKFCCMHTYVDSVDLAVLYIATYEEDCCLIALWSINPLVNTDYLPVTTGTLAVRPGGTVPVQFNFIDDSIGLEGDETFTVNLQLVNPPLAAIPPGNFFQTTLDVTITDENGKSCHNYQYHWGNTMNTHIRMIYNYHIMLQSFVILQTLWVVIRLQRKDPNY